MTVIPTHLQDLHEPTAAEIDAALDRSMRLKRQFPYEAPKTSDPATLAAHRERWEKMRAHQREGVAAALTAEYERRSGELAKLEAHDARTVATIEAELKVSFLATPGATEADFERAKPGLLAAYREREALEGPQRVAAEARRRLRRSGLSL